MAYSLSISDSSNGIVLDNTSAAILSGGVVTNTTVNSWGYLYVSSGGTANNTTVNRDGHLYISSGGTANITAVNSYGYLYVSNGGVANSTTLAEGFCSMSVSSGGTANGTTVNSGSLHIFGTANNTTVINGNLYIYSGGTATDIIWTPSEGNVTVMEGGYATFASEYSGVYYGSGNKLLSNAAVMDGMTISSSCKMNVMSGGVANSTTVNRYGYLYVSSGGMVNSTTVNTYGEFYVSSSGVANSTTVNAGGFYISNGGVANNTMVNSGNFYVFSGGTANSTTVNAGGRLRISNGGVANSITVNSGGYLNVPSGGMANEIIENGGYVDVADGANAVFTSNTISGLVLSDASATVHSGTTANSIMIDSGGSLHVFSGGMATDIIWTPCEGHVYVSEGGYATFVSEYSGVYYGSGNKLLSNAVEMNSMTLNVFEEMNVMSDGLANSTTVNSGGILEIASGGRTKHTQLGSSSYDYYYDYYYYDQTTLGKEIVASGGYAEGTVVINGTQTVCGIASDTLLSGMEYWDEYSYYAPMYISGCQNIEAGGTAFATQINSGSQGIRASGMAIDTVMFYGSQYISSGGVARNTTLSGGNQCVANGGVASGNVIRGGWHYVYAGGSVCQETISGGYQYFSGYGYDIDIIRGYISIAPAASVQNIQLHSGASIYVSGGSVINLQVESGGHVLFTFQSDGYIQGSNAYHALSLNNRIASGFVFSAGDTPYVNSGGTMLDTVLFSGASMTVQSNGAVSGIDVIAGGTVSVAGGSVTNLAMESGAHLTINFQSGGFIQGHNAYNAILLSNGVASGFVFYVGDKQNVEAGGTMLDPVLFSGAVMNVGSGCTVSGGVVASSGYMYVSQGTVSGVTVNSDGFVFIVDGSATDVTVLKGGLVVADFNASIAGTSDGSAFSIHASNATKDFTVLSGYTQIVDQGKTALRTRVLSGGRQLVSSGGYASGTLISGGGMSTYNGGIANGVVIRGGYMAVASGAAVSDTMVYSGYQTVYAGDVRNTVLSGGSQHVYGEAAGTLILSGAQYVEGNGLAVSAVVGGNGIQSVGDSYVYYYGNYGEELDPIVYGSARDTHISQGGKQIVNVCGLADGTVVSSGGTLYLSNGSAVNVQHFSGGVLSVELSAFLYEKYDDMMMYVYEYGSCYTMVSGTNEKGDFSVASGTATNLILYEHASLYVGYGMSAIGTTISSGGILSVHNGGVVLSADVEEGGQLFCSSGGSFVSGHVASGGLLAVSGTHVSGVTLDKGAVVRLDFRGEITGTSDGQTFHSSCGAVISDFEIESGYSHVVSSGYRSEQTTVRSGGILHVVNGGTATNVMQDPDAVLRLNLYSVENGACVSGRNESGAFSLGNGSAHGLVLNKSGFLSMGVGTTLSSSTILGGYVQMVSATASDIDLTYGTLYAGSWSNGSGSLVRNISVGAGGSLYLQSGTSIDGSIVVNGSVYCYGSVLAENGATITIRVNKDSHGCISNFSNLPSDGSVSFSIQAESGLNGRYRLAYGMPETIPAFGFSVDGDPLSTLSPDQSIMHNGSRYTLTKEGSDLYLDVTGNVNVESVQLISGENVSFCGPVAENMRIVVDENQLVKAGGQAVDTMIDFGGTQTVESGGIAEGTLVMSGGQMLVQKGARILTATIQSGGVARISQSGSASFLNVMGGATVEASGRIEYATVSEAGELRLAVGASLAGTITVFGKLSADGTIDADGVRLSLNLNKNSVRLNQADYFSSAVISLNVPVGETGVFLIAEQEPVENVSFSIAGVFGALAGDSVVYSGDYRYRLTSGSGGLALEVKTVHTDFSVSDFIVPATFTAGETASFSWTLTNNGEMPLDGVRQSLYLVNADSPNRKTLLKSVYLTDLPGFGETAAQTMDLTWNDTMGYANSLFQVVVEADGDVQPDDNTAVSASQYHFEQKLSIEKLADTITENSGRIRVVAKRTGSPDLAVSAVIEINDSTGLLSVPETISFAAGESEKVFYLTVGDNAEYQGDKSVRIRLQAEGYQSYSKDIVLTDDEIPELSFEIGADEVTEGESFETFGKVKLNTALDHDLRVKLTYDKAQLSGIPDYVVIKAGQTEAAFALSVVDDAVSEIDKTVKITASADGVISGRVSLLVKDNDIPAIALSVDKTVVSENAGVYALVGTITRTDNTVNYVKVKFTDANNAGLILPSVVTLGTGEKSVNFHIGIKDNSLVDGDRVATVNASIYIDSCGCTVQPVSGETQVSFTILDEDGEALGLSLSRSNVAENTVGAAKLTITRNTVNGDALTVNLNVAGSTLLDLPETVQFAAGENAVTIDVNTLTDGINTGNQMAVITASAEGYASAVGYLNISDVDLPDFEVASVSVGDSQVYAGKSTLVTLTLLNSGFSDHSGSVNVKLTLSDGTELGTYKVNGPFEAGGTKEVSFYVNMPEVVGSRTVSAVVDPDNRVSELNKGNNTGVSAAFEVKLDYIVTVETEPEVLYTKAPLTVSGTTRKLNGDAIGNMPVEVMLKALTGEKIVKTVSDAEGNYTLTLDTSDLYAGSYSVYAGNLGGFGQEQDRVEIAGMKVNQPRTAFTWDVENLTATEGSFTVSNLSGVALSGVTIRAVNAPDNFVFVADEPAALDANGQLTVNYTITAAGETEGGGYELVYGWQKINFVAESDEGVTAEFSGYFYSNPRTAVLTLSETQDVRTLYSGGEYFYEFRITNTGFGDSGEISLNLPGNDLVKLISNPVIENLAYGESTTVTLKINPAALGDGLALNAAYSGSIGISAENADATGFDFGYTFVSNDKGNITITMTDEWTQYAADRPMLSGAKVGVYNAYTEKLVATGYTDENGIVNFNDLAEGKYILKYSADKHNNAQEVVTVRGGETLELNTFLQVSTVKYTWDVRKVELTDTYEIVLSTEFETNVPAPVLTIDGPTVLPELAYGESTLMNFTVTNHGLIAAQDFTFELPEIGNGYSWRVLNDQPMDIAPNSAIVVSVKLERKTSQADSYTIDGITYFKSDMEGNSLGQYEVADDYFVSGYDADGNRVSYTCVQNGTTFSCIYDTDGLLTSLTNEEGTFRYTYDADGNLATETQPDGSVYEYDANGNVVVLTAAGSVITYSYDANGNLSGITSDGHTESYVYSEDGEQLLQYTDRNGVVSSYTYDEEGRQTGTSITENGKTTQYAFDANGNCTSVTNDTGETSCYEYDENSNLTKFTDANGNCTIYTYNNDSLPVQIRYADGTTENYSYNADGVLTSWTGRAGQTAAYAYDTDGNLISTSYSDGTIRNYTYDADGNPITANDISFSYNGNMDLTGLSFADGRKVNYTYTTGGFLSGYADELGHGVNYTYTDLGLYDRLTDESGALIVDYDYTETGYLVKETKGNGTYTNYSYDETGRLAAMEHFTSAGVLESYARYSYDSEGLCTAMETQDGTWAYSYDVKDQLTRAVFTDKAGQITQDLSYEYDAMGNRTKSVENGVVTTYVYNNLNQIVSANDFNYIYDANGNLLEDEKRIYTWTVDNRVATETLKSTGQVWEYGYDAMGNRVSFRTNGITTTWTVDENGNVIAEYVDGVWNRTYYQGELLAGFADKDGNTYYFNADALGTTLSVTGGSGAAVNTYAYDPFGNILNSSEGVDNDFTFVGGYGLMKNDSGTYYVRARNYDLETGRWISPDPIGISGGENLYAYCENNSVNIVDKNGLLSDKQIPKDSNLGRFNELSKQLEGTKGEEGTWVYIFNLHAGIAVNDSVLSSEPSYTVEEVSSPRNYPDQHNIWELYAYSTINSVRRFNIYSNASIQSVFEKRIKTYHLRRKRETKYAPVTRKYEGMNAKSYGIVTPIIHAAFDPVEWGGYLYTGRSLYSMGSGIRECAQWVSWVLYGYYDFPEKLAPFTLSAYLRKDWDFMDQQADAYYAENPDKKRTKFGYRKRRNNFGGVDYIFTVNKAPTASLSNTDSGQAIDENMLFVKEDGKTYGKVLLNASASQDNGGIDSIKGKIVSYEWYILNRKGEWLKLGTTTENAILVEQEINTTVTYGLRVKDNDGDYNQNGLVKVITPTLLFGDYEYEWYEAFNVTLGTDDSECVKELAGYFITVCDGIEGHPVPYYITTPWCVNNKAVPSQTGGSSGSSTSSVPSHGGGGGGGGSGSISVPGISATGQHCYTYFKPINASATPEGGMMSAAAVLSASEGEDEPESICAHVRMEFKQTAVMSREGFEGTLTLTNEAATEITNVTFTATVLNSAGEDVSNLFEIAYNGADGFSITQDGDLTQYGLGNKESGTFTVLYVPGRNTAMEGPEEYQFTGTISYTDSLVGDVEIDLTPITLTVNPSPSLQLHYFVERDVYADDPFTDAIEASIPAEISVLAVNAGKGDARNFSLSGLTPEIVDNQKGLLLNYTMTDAALNGVKNDNGIADVNFGTISAQSSAVAQWWYKTNIQGHYSDYSVNYQQMDYSYIDLYGNVRYVAAAGREDVSLIESADIHELIRSVQCGDDALPDFLADDQADDADTPDTLYLSTGAVEDVNAVFEAVSNGTFGTNDVVITLTADFAASWNYLRVLDPGSGDYELVGISRDGVALNARNYWQTDRYYLDELGVKYEDRLHLLDYAESAGTVEYTLTYTARDKNPLAADSLTGPDAVMKTAVDSVTVTFNKAVNADTFSWEDVDLFRQGDLQHNLITSDVTITKVNETTFVIGNLSGLTGQDGYYQMIVRTADITDTVGNKGKDGTALTWTMASAVPAVQSISGIDDLMNGRTDAIEIVFSCSIDAATLTETCFTVNGAAASGLTIEPVGESGTRFAVSGLAGLLAEGENTLELDLSQIVGINGNPGMLSFRREWTVDMTAPAVPQLSESLGLVKAAPGKLVFEASEEISVGADALTLKKDGTVIASNSLHIAVEGKQIVVTGINADSDGTYELELALDKIADAAGNIGSGTAVKAWTIDRSAPSGVAGFSLAASCDLGESDSDGRTSTRDLTLVGTLPESGLRVRIYQESGTKSRTLLRELTPEGTALQTEVKVQSGHSVLIAELTDAAGNTSETRLTVFVDEMSVSAKFQEEFKDELSTSPEEITFELSEEVNGLSIANFRLSVDGKEVLLDGANLVRKEGLAYAVTGIQASANGVYTLSLDMNGLVKTSTGLACSGTQSVSWTVHHAEAPTVVSSSLDPSQIMDGLAVFSIEFSGAMNCPDLIESGAISHAVRIVEVDENNNVVRYISLASEDFQYIAETDTLVWNSAAPLDLGGHYRLVLDTHLLKSAEGIELAGGSSAEQNSYQTSEETVIAEPAGSGTGTGAFAVPVWYDLDGDGKLDLIVGEKTTDTEGKVRVLRNTGTTESPSFDGSVYLQGSSGDWSIAAANCLGVAPRFADVNGDGNADLVYGASNGRIGYAVNNNGVFSSGTALLLADGTEIDVGDRAVFDLVDWNGDGTLDIVSGAMDGKIYLFINNGDWTFAAAQTLSVRVENGWSAPAVADLNDDGALDIVSGDGQGNLHRFLNNGDGTFTETEVSAGDSLRSRPAIADVNGDGIPDITVGYANGKVSVLYGGKGDVVAEDFHVNTSPVFSGTPAATVDGYQVTISWEAASDDVGVSGYKVRIGSTEYRTAGTTLTLTDVDVGTYSYQVGAFDEAGLEGWSTQATFTVKDITPPVLNGAPEVRVWKNTARLSWSPASDNVGIAGYRVEVNGTVYELSANASPHFLSGLDLGTYEYRIGAFDAADQVAWSDKQTFSVTELPDALDHTLTETVPTADYGPGCVASSIGMLLGYYDKYGYCGFDVSGLIPGEIEIESRNSANARLNTFIASDGYFSRFLGKTAEEERAYSLTDQNELNPAAWDSLADWLGTGQKWRGNEDYATAFYYGSLNEIRKSDLTYTVSGVTLPAKYADFKYGLSLFVESLDYMLDGERTRTVKADTLTDGTFSFADFVSEIDAGRGVLISLASPDNLGHMVLGYGYNEASQEIIFDDTSSAGQRMAWNGSYAYAGHEYTIQSVTTVVFDKANLNIKPDVVPQTQTWEKAAEDTKYIVELSTDDGHAVQLMVDSNSLDSFRMPTGNYRMRVKPEGGEWSDPEPVVSTEATAEPKFVKSDANGSPDVFFANPIGTWKAGYLAQHVGTQDDIWGGTGENATLFGRNKLADIIEGSTDANILLMTDNANGDALFVDDIYSALPGSVSEQQSRIAQIDEIRAGFGNDIVDMTSQRFKYVGAGLTIRGGAGDDTIWANKGDNFLFGDAGNDRIVGASGNDVIAGGIGNDSMHGGGGDDVFTFCDNWGTDTVEQLATGSVTLWFASGSEANWNAETLTYTDGDNSVKVIGANEVTLKFGKGTTLEDEVQFATLSSIGAFEEFTSERIFEEKGKGILASLG